jgi:hypothetical protein
MKNPAEMTAAEINRELDRLEKLCSAFTDEMIAAGRGYERPSEWMKRDDPLSQRGRAAYRRCDALRIEMELRYGPDCPARLPRGFGPRKQF